MTYRRMVSEELVKFPSNRSGETLIGLTVFFSAIGDFATDGEQKIILKLVGNEVDVFSTDGNRLDIKEPDMMYIYDAIRVLPLNTASLDHLTEKEEWELMDIEEGTLLEIGLCRTFCVFFGGLRRIYFSGADGKVTLVTAYNPLELETHEVAVRDMQEAMMAMLELNKNVKYAYALEKNKGVVVAQAEDKSDTGTAGDVAEGTRVVQDKYSGGSGDAGGAGKV
jgi:hypothetical protein